MKILIDPAHGKNIAGKRSPDERLLEYKYSRDICTEIVKQLKTEGYDAELTVVSENEPGLTERVKLINSICNELGAKNVCLVSVHVNAAGNGDKWYDATYWCAYTSKGQTRGDNLAECIYNAAERLLSEHGKNIIKTDLTDNDKDIESNFTILHKTKCAACLTENLFMDNKANVDWLLSEHGKNIIIKLHVDGIKDYIKNYHSK